MIRQRILINDRGGHGIHGHLERVDCIIPRVVIRHDAVSFVGGRDLNDVGLAQSLPEAGIFDKEECLFFPDGASKRHAEFISLERRHGRETRGRSREVISRVESAVAQELKRTTVKLIGAALADDLGDGAAALPVFGGVIVLQDLEFGNGVEVEVLKLGRAHLRIADIGVIQSSDHRLPTIAISDPLPPRPLAGHPPHSTGVGDYAGLHEDKSFNASAVEGQVLDLFLRYQAGDRRIGGVEQRRRSIHFHGLRDP